MITATQLQQVENKMLEILLKLESHYKKPMPFPKIVFERMGLRFGSANHATQTITLNSDLCDEKHWNELLNDTLPHEICHLVAPFVYNQFTQGYDAKRGRGHGITWKMCMRVIGLEPRRCGDMDEDTKSKVSLRKIRRGFVYKSPCGKTFNLTLNLHNKILNGSNRFCMCCRQTITFAGYKVEN